MFKKILIANLTAWLLALSTASFGCSLNSSKALNKLSDVVVFGTTEFHDQSRSGILKAIRIEKGARAKTYRIVWVPQSDQELETTCPSWFPLNDREQGTYFLKARTDGSYEVLDVNNRKRVK
jgi:hypothetical protein